MYTLNPTSLFILCYSSIFVQGQAVTLHFCSSLYNKCAELLRCWDFFTQDPTTTIPSSLSMCLSADLFFTPSLLQSSPSLELWWMDLALYHWCQWILFTSIHKNPIAFPECHKSPWNCLLSRTECSLIRYNARTTLLWTHNEKGNVIPEKFFIQL